MFQGRPQVDRGSESLDGQQPVSVVAELHYPWEQFSPFLSQAADPRRALSRRPAGPATRTTPVEFWQL